MTIVWLKLVHVAALAVWASGILLMPVLLGQRVASGRGAELDRLHAFTRFAYVAVTSPAAFVTIATGTALIFARPVADPWLALKLLLVGGLVALHVWSGLLALSIFDEGGRFARWRVWTSLVVLSTLIAAILWVVLAKPSLPPAPWPDLLRPGGLRGAAAGLIPGLTP